MSDLFNAVGRPRVEVERDIIKAVTDLQHSFLMLEHDKIAALSGRIDGIGEALSILVKNLEAFKEEVRMKRKK